MKRRNQGGSMEPVVGYIEPKNLALNDVIAGTYLGSFTTKGEYPKTFSKIRLARPLTFLSYNTEAEANVTVNGQIGEVVAVQSGKVLTSELTAEDVGQEITLVFEGQSENKKKGQKPAYLFGIYDGLPTDEELAATGTEAPAPAAKPASTKPAGKNFPFGNKK